MTINQNEKIYAKSSDIINTVVGAGTRLKGTIDIKNSGRIDGMIEGGVTSDQEIIIGESGYIEGHIISRRAIIGGKVVGTVKANEKVILENKAVLTGDIHTNLLEILDGARFNGKTYMRRHPEKEKTVERETPHPNF